MSKIQYYRYELIPKVGGQPRKGALLRINGGYADLCPLPEFGDATIEKQLVSLIVNTPYPLAKNACFFAGRDAEKRLQGKSWFADIAPPENHALFPDLTGQTVDNLQDAATVLLSQGFRTFKVKVGRDSPDQEALLLNHMIAHLPDGTRLRLDPNARFSPDTCLSFLNQLSEKTRTAIEFIEDPTPFDLGVWRTLYDQFGIPIAADFEGDSFNEEETPPYQVRILKPTRESPRTLLSMPLRGIKLVITSALEHPIGQMGAAFWAGTMVRDNPGVVSPICGIASHLIYEENPFSAQLTMEGSRLIPPPGTGWGFGELLEALPWIDLD